MKPTVTTTAFAFLLFRCISAEIGIDRFLAFPQAFVVLESGGTQTIEEVSRKFIPAPTAQEQKFRGAHTFADGTFVQWDMVRKTDYGDIYLIVTERPGSEPVAKPVLFAGAPQTIVATKGVTVRILPRNPRDEK